MHTGICVFGYAAPTTRTRQLLRTRFGAPLYKNLARRYEYVIGSPGISIRILSGTRSAGWTASPATQHRFGRCRMNFAKYNRSSTPKNHVAKPYAEWLADAQRLAGCGRCCGKLHGGSLFAALDRKGCCKYPVLRPPGKERFVRFKTLGKQRYTPEVIKTGCFIHNSTAVSFRVSNMAVCTAKSLAAS